MGYSLFVLHSLNNLSPQGTPFHLLVSIWNGAVPPLSIISTLLWLFSLIFQHLELKQFTHTEFKTQSLSLLLRSSAQSFSTHLHTTLLTISLSCPLTPQPEKHSCSHANQGLQNRSSAYPSTVLLAVRATQANLRIRQC